MLKCVECGKKAEYTTKIEDPTRLEGEKTINYCEKCLNSHSLTKKELKDIKAELKELTIYDGDVGLYGMSLEEAKLELIKNSNIPKNKIIIAYNVLKKELEE